jgi:nitrous oxidase accessory protein NosD
MASYLVSSSGNIIFDNSFNNTNNAGFVDASTNAWSIPQEPGTNIRGGPTLGGNFWAHPNGTGFSVMTPDSDGDGVCDTHTPSVQGTTIYCPLPR